MAKNFWFVSQSLSVRHAHHFRYLGESRKVSRVVQVESYGDSLLLEGRHIVLLALCPWRLGAARGPLLTAPFEPRGNADCRGLSLVGRDTPHPSAAREKEEGWLAACSSWRLSQNSSEKNSPLTPSTN